MKARVFVTLKKTVLDPQGQTIQKALAGLGYRSVQDVRQGKVFEIELNGISKEEARQQVERVARDVLTNPVIEEFRYELEE
jgi:phosphoribosylformylglycinamidine synthase